MAKELGLEKSVICRHVLDEKKIKTLISLLRDLPKDAPALLHDRGLDPDDYDLYFRSAIESIRGVFSADGEDKRRFYNAVFDHMKSLGDILEWECIGTKGRQDYKITLPGGRKVCIEAKGCPDGNNMTIWERPTWAEEFIVWSQCPDSLQHHPGRGIWSGIATRLVTKMVVERQQIDGFIFFDGRCGSDNRRCPKEFGVVGDLRAKATPIKGQDDGNRLPPPCIYLFPKTIPHPLNNKTPPVHDLNSLLFADRLLNSFGVPPEKRPDYVNAVRVEMRSDEKGYYLKTSISVGLNNPTPVVASGFKRLKRE